MSVTNFIDDERITIEQGVNGICLCREAWMIREKADKQCSKFEPVEGESREASAENI